MHAGVSADYLNNSAELFVDLGDERIVSFHIEHTHAPDMSGQVPFADEVG